MPDTPIAETRPQHTVSSIALVASNAITALGVIFFHWSVFPVLLIYWLENVIIGGYNVLRMLVAECPGDPMRRVRKAILIPFFCVHFGGFCAMQGLFVLALFAKFDTPPLSPEIRPWAMLPLAIHRSGFGFAVIALCVSHGASFVMNYIRSGEYRRASVEALMFQPYKRVIVLHLVIFASAAPIVLLQSPLPAVVALVVVKTLLDHGAHSRERAELAETDAAVTSA